LEIGGTFPLKVGLGQYFFLNPPIESFYTSLEVFFIVFRVSKSSWGGSLATPQKKLYNFQKKVLFFQKKVLFFQKKVLFFQKKLYIFSKESFIFSKESFIFSKESLYKMFTKESFVKLLKHKILFLKKL
jgi:hypothetical protein